MNKYEKYLKDQVNIVYDNIIKNGEATRKEWQLIALEFCRLSGLRVFELTTLKWNNINELLSRNTTVSLIRKYKSLWMPIYYEEFVSFIDRFFNLYKYNESEFVFPFKSQTLLNLTKMIFIKATKTQPPKGFGTHTNRYFLATKNRNKNIGIVQRLLGHAKSSTSINYIKNQKAEDEINEIIDTVPSIRNLYDLLI